MMTTEQQQKKGPLFEARDGAIKATVWERSGRNGNFPEVTFTRLYKKDGSEAWSETPNLRIRDLAKLQALAAEVMAKFPGEAAGPAE